MQNSHIAMTIAAVLAVVVLIYLNPVISTAGKTNRVLTVVLSAMVYLVAWFFLCYAVAIGMYLVGRW